MTSGSLVRGRRGVQRHASWLELFFDLLFVALFSELAHELVRDLRPAMVLGALGLFAPAWWAWVSYTVSTNLFGEGGPGHRGLILATMGCLLVMIAGIGKAFDGDPALYAAGFAASRVVLLVLVAAWQARTPHVAVPTASYICYSTTVVLFGASIFTPAPVAYVLWAIALAVEIAFRFLEQSADHHNPDMPPLDIDLLIERFGLIVMVALGEGVAGVGGAITEANGNGRALAAGIAGFGLLAGLWWWYFDLATTTMPAGYEAKPEHTIAIARDVHVVGHYILVGAIVTVSAGLRPIIAAVAHSGTAATAMGLVADALAVIVLTLVAMSFRLGAGVARTVVAVIPTLVALAVVAGARNHLSLLTALYVCAAAVACAVALQHARLSAVRIDARER